MMDASSVSIGNVCAINDFIFAIHKFLAMSFIIVLSSLGVLHLMFIVF